MWENTLQPNTTTISELESVIALIINMINASTGNTCFHFQTQQCHQ